VHVQEGASSSVWLGPGVNDAVHAAVMRGASPAALMRDILQPALASLASSPAST
jgi:hypothetical protein